jgi:hypothetical protein
MNVLEIRDYLTSRGLDIQTDRLLQMINQNIINNRENNGKYI